MSLKLPGLVPPVLQVAYDALSKPRRTAFKEHLLGGTSSEYLSEWLARAGTPVASSTIKRYRRSLSS